MAGRAPEALHAPEALRQGGGAHPAQEEEQHAVVGDARRAPEGNLLHQGDQEAGGEDEQRDFALVTCRTEVQTAACIHVQLILMSWCRHVFCKYKLSNLVLVSVAIPMLISLSMHP